MVKLVVVGFWVCLVTLGAVFFSVQMATAPVADIGDKAKKDPGQLVRGEPITVPLIADGAIKGYFLGRVSFMMNKDKIKGVELPMTEIMTDEMFTLLVGNKMVDITSMSSFDLTAFRETIKTDLNKRLGEGFVEEVLVEQLDYLSKEDIRASGEGTKKPMAPPVKIVEGVTLEDRAHSGN